MMLGDNLPGPGHYENTLRMYLGAKDSYTTELKQLKH